MFSFLSKIPVISQIDPSKTWVYYQLAVVIGTWVFAAGIWYTAYLIKFKVVPILEREQPLRHNAWGIPIIEAKRDEL